MDRLSSSGSHLSTLEFSSLTSRVVEALVAAIIGGELKPGDRLVERELAARLGVSKTPVREAIRVVGQRGLATVSAFRGAEVTAVDEELAHNTYQVRELLEPVAVRLSVPLHTEATIALAQAAFERVDGLTGGEDIPHLSLANRDLHRLLYAPCPNQLLRVLVDDLQDRTALINVQSWARRSPNWLYEEDDHRAIIQAVQAGDAALAEERLREHIRRSASLAFEPAEREAERTPVS